MKPQEKANFTKMILATAEYYEKDLGKNGLEIYWQGLIDLEFEAISKAVAAHTKDPATGKWMPKVSEIRDRLCRPAKTSIIAWAQVEDAYCKYNYYATVQFEDGVINSVIRDLGGWPWLCSQNLEEPWTQKEFERRYTAYKGQGYEINEPLPGFHEIHNRNGGFLDYVPDTVLISEDGQATMLPPHLPKELPEAQQIIKLLADKMEMEPK